MTHDIAREIEKDCWGEETTQQQVPHERVVMRHEPADHRPCYICGRRADEHPWVTGYKGRRRGKCPTDA